MDFLLVLGQIIGWWYIRFKERYRHNKRIYNPPAPPAKSAYSNRGQPLPIRDRPRPPR